MGEIMDKKEMLDLSKLLSSIAIIFVMNNVEHPDPMLDEIDSAIKKLDHRILFE